MYGLTAKRKNNKNYRQVIKLPPSVLINTIILCGQYAPALCREGLSFADVKRILVTRSLPHSNDQTTIQQHAATRSEDLARQGKDSVFQIKSVSLSPTILENMERRDRAVFLLVNGKRTLQDIARLVHRSEIEVAYILVHLVKRHFIEFVDTRNDQRRLSN